MKGYIQVYTGDGKGKTTAALGLALRAVGAGKKVLLVQFLKGRPSSEECALSRLAPDITLKQYGRKRLILSKPQEKDIAKAQEGLKEVQKALRSKHYDLIILDEINMAVYLKVLAVEDLLSLLQEKPENLELVLTGRNAHPRVLEKADLVTEMKEIKHYYSRGVKARTGIEK